MTIIQKNVYFRFHNDFRSVCFGTGCFQQTIAYGLLWLLYEKRLHHKKCLLQHFPCCSFSAAIFSFSFYK